jgi:hypothetical protein
MKFAIIIDAVLIHQSQQSISKCVNPAWLQGSLQEDSGPAKRQGRREPGIEGVPGGQEGPWLGHGWAIWLGHDGHKNRGFFSSRENTPCSAILFF